MNPHAKSLLLYLLKTRNFKDPELSLITKITNALSASEQESAFTTLKNLYDHDRELNVEIASVLSICFYYGIGVTKNEDEAFQLASFAEEKENQMGRYMMGFYVLDIINDTKTALGFLRPLADKGYAPAQSTLGSCFANGKGVEKDLNKAVELYKAAALQEYADGLFQLGDCYSWGKGVEQDGKKASELFKTAALYDHVEGQYRIGRFYFGGIGVERDFMEAVEWYKKAGLQGHALAQYNVGYFYRYGIGVVKNMDEAVKWFKKAALQEHAEAQYDLGFCYANGEGVVKNSETALGLYFSSARLGSKFALKYLRDNEVDPTDASFVKKFKLG